VPLYLLARIIASGTATFRGFNGLAVNHTGAGAWLLVLKHTPHLHQRKVDIG